MLHIGRETCKKATRGHNFWDVTSRGCYNMFEIVDLITTVMKVGYEIVAVVYNEFVT